MWIVTAHTIFRQKESQWKLRQHYQNFSMEGKPCRTKRKSTREGKLTIRVKLLEINKLEESSPGWPVPPEYVGESLWWMLKAPNKNTSAKGLTRGIFSKFNDIIVCIGVSTPPLPPPPPPQKYHPAFLASLKLRNCPSS